MGGGIFATVRRKILARGLHAKGWWGGGREGWQIRSTVTAGRACGLGPG